MVREGRVFISPTAGNPQYGVGYYVTSYEVGAQVTAASSGTTATVAAGHGFAANDKFINGTDVTQYRTVTAVTSTTLTLSADISLAKGDLLVNLAQDTGTIAPNYDGAGLTIYTDMDYTNQATYNTVLTDQYGRYRYFHRGIARWELVRNSTGLPIATYSDTGIEEMIHTYFNVKEYGAIGDGVADDYVAISAALAAATVNGGEVYFPSSTGGYKIGTSISFPYTVEIKVDINAILKPDSGTTMRVQGPIDAGLYQIFGGVGSSVLIPVTATEVLYGPSSIPEAPIQWWGCYPNTTVDCGPSIQTALASIAPGTFLTFHGGTFKIATGIVLTRRYFNMRGETGGYYPGAGYPTFLWTGADNGTMFMFTDPFGIQVEMCSFDGDFSADTVFKIKSDSLGTVSWNCGFDKCAFVACRGDSFVMGGGHGTYNDDFSQMLFTQCWFSRPGSRSSDASGNSLTLANIPSGRHFLARAWNSYNVTFDTCHFYSISPSSDANQYDRVGIYAQGGELVFVNCMFYNRGTDIVVADPNPGTVQSYILIRGGESQSEELLRVPAFTGITPNRNFVIDGLRHIQSFGSTYTPTRTTSISFNGAAGNSQYGLVLIGNVFNHDIELGTNAPKVIDVSNRFAAGKRYTGVGINQVGGGHGRRDLGAEKTIAFTSGGTYQIVVGNTITGAISGATAIVEFVLPLTSGTWAGGDAAGTLELRYQSGTFEAENLNVGSDTNVATIAGNTSASTWNMAAYGHVLARNANNILWYDDAYSNRWAQNDWWWNHKTSDTVLACDAIRKYVQGDAQNGKLVTFFGSVNYEGDTTTSVNGTVDFVKSYSAGTLTLTTKVSPVANSVYEVIWRCGVDDGSTAAKSSRDCGVGHIYVVRDYVSAADYWRMEYAASSGYTNQVGTNLTMTALFYNTVSPAEGDKVAYSATISTDYVIRLKLVTLTADGSAAFYGIIRRIM